MEEFIKYCTDTRPNITYLAIGSAYSIYGGFQQHPPFLEKIILQNQDFNVQIILIDPMMENPPEITKHFGIYKIEENWYGNDNLSVHIIREKFFLNNILNNCVSPDISTNLLNSLINRTIMAKQINPNNTYLLFVHDFTGCRIDIVSDRIHELYKNQDETIYYLYKKNILIDLNNKIDSGCFVDMNSIYFHPQLLRNSHNAFEIFNPYMLTDFELYSIILQNYKNPNFKLLLMHSLNHRFNYFANNMLVSYRQIRMAFDKKIHPNIEIPEMKFLLENINFTHPNHDMIQIITGKLLKYLESIIGYLNLFGAGNNFFDEFINMCKNMYIQDYYQLTIIFNKCKKNMEVFISNINPNDYYVELNHYSVQYVQKYKKLPLFMEILLQDLWLDDHRSINLDESYQNTLADKLLMSNNQNIINDIYTIIEL